MGNNKFNIIYSPAHIEEIAVSEQRYNTSKDIIENDLKELSLLTNNQEILPHHGEIIDIKYGTYIKEEHPRICYERVIKDYNNLNNKAEAINEQVLNTSKENDFYGNEPSKINNILPEEILKKLLDETHINIKSMFVRNYNFSIKEISNLYDIKLNTIAKFNFDFSDFNDNFFKISTIVEMLANLLEAHGYNYEKSKKGKSLEKARSRMHDVSHIIYGSYVDKFIIGDKKLFKKTKAIYHYLNIKTEVLFYSQEEKELLSNI